MKAWLALGVLSTVSVASLVFENDVRASQDDAARGKMPASKASDPKALPPKAAAAEKTPTASDKAPVVKTPTVKTSLVKSPTRHGKTAMRTQPTMKAPREKVKPPCFHDPVTVVHFAEEDTFPLTRCDGTVAHLAVERLSVLARPGSAAKPEADPTDLAKMKGDRIAPGIRRVDPKLVERIQALVTHFSKGKPARLQIISGYRPASSGSYHATGRALDVRIDGVPNEALVAFCKTLPDTGCGYYPNSSFIHIDVRRPGTGHVAWIDASGPGEAPRYVSAWPPPPSSSPNAAPPNGVPEEVTPSTVEEALSKLERGLAPLPADEHTPVARDAKEAKDDFDPEPSDDKSAAAERRTSEPSVSGRSASKNTEHGKPAAPASPEKSTGTPRYQL